MLLIILAAVVLIFLLNAIVEKLQGGRAPGARVLYLRELTAAPSSMVTMVGQEHKNPFTAEFIVVFEYISNILDYAVMKYVGEDVSILSKQEGKHAVLHLAAMKQRKSDGEAATRWRWFLWLADFLILRCGRTLGTSLVVHIEAAAWAWFFLPAYLPFVKTGLPNLFIFHGMEEVEHGALTVQSLRSRTNILLSILTFPVVVIVHIVLLLCPPISTIMMHPGLLLMPHTYVDLVNYYLAFGPSFIATFIGQVAYCLFPLPENQSLFKFMNKFYQSEMKVRGITFNIVDQETYKLH